MRPLNFKFSWGACPQTPLVRLVQITHVKSWIHPCKGHCINFSQDIQELANSLPRNLSEMPVIVVSVKGKDNTYKDLTVRREKVSCALHWLVQHNPVYKDITIDYELLAFLPSDGIPTELRKIYCTENSKDDEIDPAGPA